MLMKIKNRLAKSALRLESTPSSNFTLVSSAPSRFKKMALNATIWTTLASRSLYGIKRSCASRNVSATTIPAIS